MTICGSCAKKEGHMNCGLCQSALCRDCAQIVNEPDFSFMREAPKGLTHGLFCSECFHQTVLDQIDSYNAVMEKARDVSVFMKDQSKETRLFRRKEKPIVIEDCFDRDETLMRLAFQAAQLGYNTLVDVDLTSKKIFDHAYQTSSWRGIAFPVQLTEQQRNRT